MHPVKTPLRFAAGITRTQYNFTKHTTQLAFGVAVVPPLMLLGPVVAMVNARIINRFAFRDGESTRKEPKEETNRQAV